MPDVSAPNISIEFNAGVTSSGGGFDHEHLQTRLWKVVNLLISDPQEAEPISGTDG